MDRREFSDHKKTRLVSTYLLELFRFFEQCDLVLMSSSYVLEREAIDAFKAWFSETKKDVYGIGPLLPANYWSTQGDGGASAIQVFLDAMLQTHGRKSVVLVRSISRITCIYSFTALIWTGRLDFLRQFGLANGAGLRG